MAATQILNTPLYNDANLVSYYELENANDNKGSNNLTNANSVTFTAGLFNNAANFGSSSLSNKALQRTDGLGVDLSGQWACTCWVNITTAPTSGQNVIIWDWRSTSGTARYCILHYQNSGGTKILYTDNAGTNNPTSNQDLGTGTWHNIVVQKEGDGKTHLYLDNVAIGTPTNNAGGSAGNELGVGNVADPGGSNSIAGLVDDIAFFNRSLTTAEINGINNGFSSVSTASGVPQASIFSANGIASANIKIITGVANQ